MECIWSGGSEDASVSSLTGTVGSPEDGKPDLVVSELDAPRPSDFVLLVEDCSSDDGNGVRRGTMVPSHFSVELANSTIQGNISVFLIHVVVSSP